MPSLVYPDVSGRNANYEGLVRSMAPVGYWPLGETNGTVAVDLGSSGDGTYVNSPVIGAQPGPIARVAGVSRAATLNGTNQYVSLPLTSPLATGSATLSAFMWCRTPDLTADQRFIWAGSGSNTMFLWMDTGDGADGWAVALYNPASAAFVAGTTIASAVANKWQHVGFTCEAGAVGGLKLYVDGGVIASVNAPASLLVPTIHNVGFFELSGGQYAEGQAAHYFVADYVVTPAQIESLYLCGLNGQ